MTTGGVVLAGGEAKRLPRKPFRLLDGQPLLAHVVARARPQVDRLCISVAARSDGYEAFALPLVVDGTSENLGPVAGVLSALRWAAASGASHLAAFPCDSPFLPEDLVSRLALALGSAPLAVAAACGRVHFTCALWDVTLVDLVSDALASGERRLHRVIETAGATIVDFGDTDAFLNVNSEDDLRVAEGRLADQRVNGR